MAGYRTAVFAAVLAWSTSVHAEGVARLVLVVGNNRPADAHQAPLRFADDDAIRFHERFEGLAEGRVLLTRLDHESRSYRRAYPVIAPPTIAQLRRSTILLRARAASLRAQGRFVEFVFIFAGHGGMEGGRPYLALEDGRLGRDEVEELFLAGNPADVVHVVIDACSAASFVESRGPLPTEREPLGSDVLPFGGLVERYPRAGFIAAASAGGSAFEWSRFGSGVASHLILSALSGAADMAPPDGRVTYDEVDAFLHTATQDILPSDYRQEIRVIPPRRLPSAAIVELRQMPWSTELLVDRPGRYYVRDADGRRIVDLRHGRGTVRLLLPLYSPRFVLVERREEGDGCGAPGRHRSHDCRREDRPHEITAATRARASALPPAEATVLTRGVVEDSVFEQLFASPYDAGSVMERRDGAAALEVRTPRDSRATECPDPTGDSVARSRPRRPVGRDLRDPLGLRRWEDD